ncbi:MAG: glycosyltransferase family 4 protein [Calditrichia bacterium]
MRIAYICADPGVPVFGKKGCSIHVQEVVREMIRQGATVDLFSPRVEGKPPAGLETVQTHLLPQSTHAKVPGRERQAMAANYNLQKALVNAGGFDLIYERYSLWSYAGMEYAHGEGIPGLLEVNAPLIEEQNTYRVLIHLSEAEHIAHRVFSRASAIIAVSENIAGYLHQFGISPQKIAVIPNGVNPQKFPQNLAPSCPVSDNIFTIGFVGTLKAWHGLETLVNAFALFHRRVPVSRLLIVGDGPQREIIEKQLSEKNLSRAVHFTGAVPHEEVPGLLASMDVAVAPYPEKREFYFSPLKIFEYMAAGLPVIASRIGQIAKVIRHGVNGMLYSPGNVDELVEILIQCQRAPALQKRLGESARETVLQEFTWEKVVQLVFQIAKLPVGNQNPFSNKPMDTAHGTAR